MIKADIAIGFLGTKNPFSKEATAKDNAVWLLDNTAYRPKDAKTGELQPWQAEFVAAYFTLGRTDLNKAVSNIVDTIGLDGDLGKNPEVVSRIESRLLPFVQSIGPARTTNVLIPSLGGPVSTRTLGPSDPNGISSQILLTGGPDDADGKAVHCASAEGFPKSDNTLNFVGPEGWLVISDIDDTIKVSKIISQDRPSRG